MSGWDDRVVLLIVAIAAGWFALWLRGVWKHESTLCNCDQQSCSSARKLKSLAALSGAEGEQPSSDNPPSQEDPAKPAASKQSRNK